MKKVLRILGLLIISVVAVFYLSIIIGGFFEGETITTDFESIGMLILVILTIISVIIAWIRTRIGAWVALGVGIVFSIFGVVTAGGNRILAVIGAGGPIVIGSLLIILGLDRSKSKAEE